MTGRLVGVRLQADQIKAIDAWAAKQSPAVTRPEAIPGMIDMMLHIIAKDPSEKPRRSTPNKLRAAELAAKAIDKMGDQSAAPEERAQRRRRLTKGPPEFREDRVDLPKVKGK